jgi:hypothetical protein
MIKLVVEDVIRTASKAFAEGKLQAQQPKEVGGNCAYLSIHGNSCLVGVSFTPEELDLLGSQMTVDFNGLLGNVVSIHGKGVGKGSTTSAYTLGARAIGRLQRRHDVCMKPGISQEERAYRLVRLGVVIDQAMAWVNGGRYPR